MSDISSFSINVKIFNIATKTFAIFPRTLSRIFYTLNMEKRPTKLVAKLHVVAAVHKHRAFIRGFIDPACFSYGACSFQLHCVALFTLKVKKDIHENSQD